MALAPSMTAGSVRPRCGGKSLSSDFGELGFKSGQHGFDPLRHEARYGSRLRDQDKSGLQLLVASPHGLYPSVHVAERRSPSRDRYSPDHSHAGPVQGPVCKRCESTGVDSLKTILQQQQDDAMLRSRWSVPGLEGDSSSRGCASWLGVRALSSSPTPLARYRTCVQVWRRCLILGEVSVQCSRWLIAKKGVRIFAHRTSSLLC